MGKGGPWKSSPAVISSSVAMRCVKDQSWASLQIVCSIAILLLPGFFLFNIFLFPTFLKPGNETPVMKREYQLTRGKEKISIVAET